MVTTESGRKPFRSLFTTQKLVAGPWAEPMDIAEAKQQARRGADITTEDQVIRRYITTAREQVERDTMRALLWQERSLSLDEWPDRIDIYACPVRSVEITYLDQAGETQTVPTSVYRTRLDLEPATITLKNGQIWPSALSESGAITVSFAAGYAVPFTADPATDVLTFTGYEPTNGETFRLTNSGGLCPGGLSESIPYYVINASGSTCKLSLTEGGAAVDVTSAGSGLHFLGSVPQSAMHAMRLLVAISFAAREGDVPSNCYDAVANTLRAIKYTFG